MGSVSILGTDSIEIYQDPVGSAPPELIRRRHITGVFPIKFAQRQPSDDMWAYPYDTITRICFMFRDGKKQRHLMLELQNVSNQPNWNTGTEEALRHATSDIYDWLNNGSLVPSGSFIDATGGTITTDGNFRIHTFNGDGTFNVTNAGTAPYNTIEFLIVAGGAGGGGFAYGAGGGAGGVLPGTDTLLAPVSFPIVVGAGGPGGPATNSPSVATNGSNSTFNGLTAIGGGKGGNFGVPDATINAGGNGGSGGGSSASTVPGSVGTGTVGQGNNGGLGAVFIAGSGDAFGGGGGGASQVGGNATATGLSTGTGGNGGDGYLSSISGTPTYYGGGGGGGNGGTGGLGGGASSSGAGSGSNGTANKGGGGSGVGNSFPGTGGNGGSGVVIIRYRFQ